MEVGGAGQTERRGDSAGLSRTLEQLLQRRRGEGPRDGWEDPRQVSSRQRSEDVEPGELHHGRSRAL